MGPAIPAHITLTTDETTSAHPPAFEDACSPNPLPGFQQLEKFCSLLVEIGLPEDKLSLSTKQRNKLIYAWNAVEEHDKQPQQFHHLYKTHRGSTLYCRTKRDDLADAALIQCVKMSRRYAQAPQDISAQHNKLMYVLVKLLWLASPCGTRSSPEKKPITKAYERVQHRVLIEDPVLSKLGIPLPKINTKTVRDFICRQERLLNLQSTKIPSAAILKTTSISSTDLPPTPCQPSVLPPPEYPLIQYDHIPSKAGTKVLKERTDIMIPKSVLQLQQLKPALKPHVPLPVSKTVVTGKSTITKHLPNIPSATPVTPATSTNTSSMTTFTSEMDTSQSVDTAWARATLYKRKNTDNLTNVGTKLSRVQNLPICTLCHQPTQGHKKYKKKSFCPVKMMSTSKGLDNTVYTSYEHFTSVVDSQQ